MHRNTSYQKVAEAKGDEVVKKLREVTKEKLAEVVVEDLVNYSASFLAHYKRVISQLAGSTVQAVAPQTQTMQVTPAVVVNAEPATHGSSGTTNASVADEIHKLNDLHEQGILTDAEFAQAKSKLLEQP